MTSTPDLLPTVAAKPARKTRQQLDAEHHATRPYDLMLKLEGSKSEWMFGRFKTAERAFEIADQCMRATRRSDLPHGRKCRGYRVVNWLTGDVVDRAELERVAGVMKVAA